jgi:hypothetical protein
MSRGKHWALPVLVLALGCLAMCAPSALARPRPKPSGSGLLSDRSCLGLLDIGDFTEAKEERLIPLTAGDHPEWEKATFCTYWNHTLAEYEGGGEKPENVGADSLTVWSRLIFKRHPDLFSWHLSAPFLFGKRYVLHGVGTHAVWGINKEGDKEAAMQVRNDVFTVSEFSGGVRQVLSKVAHELSPTGK